MRRILGLVALVLLAVPVCGGASPSDEKRLERRARRFYTYYYLNHYDEMWEVFHPDLRERLGNDEKAYIRSLRDSDLELYEADIREVRVEGERGTVEVDLVFFFEGVGEPIPRRHRMLWILRDGRWWYGGSRLLEETEPLRGEVATRSDEQERQRPGAPERTASGEEGEDSPGREVIARKAAGEAASVGPAPPTGETRPARQEDAQGEKAAETDAGAEIVPEREAAPPASEAEEVARLEPAGLPEERASPEELSASARPPIYERLQAVGLFGREAELRRLSRRLGPEDLEGLVAAAHELSRPLRRWSVLQMGRLAQRHPELREQVVGVLVSFVDEDATGSGLRAQAARALRPLEAPEAREALEDLLLEGDEEQKIEAARALGALGDPASVPFLEATWRRSSAASPLRLVSLRALGAMRTEAAAAILREVALDPRGGQEERLTALRGLVAHAELVEAELFRTLYREHAARQDPTRGWQGRVLAVAGLIRAEGGGARGLLEELLDDSPKLHAGGEELVLARALAARGDLETVRLLLEDPRPAARLPAAYALAEMAAAGSDEAAALARAAGADASNARVRAVLQKAGGAR